jgi:hypothetical protein
VTKSAFIVDIKNKIRQEISAALSAKDEWLLVHLSRKRDGSISIGSDTVFCGFENSKELRGPRWRPLASAREFADQGYKWIVAGEVSAWALFQQLINDDVPPGVVMHAEAVERWAPECAKETPTLNSIRGFLNPSLPENQSLAARRPGRSARVRQKGAGCAICDSKTEVTLHHLIPREMGGATEEENLLPVCRPCHDAIHNGNLDVSNLVLQVSVKRAKYLMETASNTEE